MRDQTSHAARRDDGTPLAGVKRLELLSWRFSQTEVQSLSLLQLVHRQQPNVLDIPVAESRLQFARWLVEHGRLSEGLEPAAEETLGIERTKYPSPGQQDVPVLPRRPAVVYHTCRPEGETARSADTDDVDDVDDVDDTEVPRESTLGHRVLRGAVSWLRWGRIKFAACWHELTRPDYPPYGMGSWGTWGPYGTYDPYGPRSPWGDPRWISDPSYWMRYRHDD